MPAGWLRGQDTAYALITRAGLAWPRASFEFRSTHDVLALTVMLAGIAGSRSVPTADELRFVRHLLADDVEWAVWCQGGLDRPAPGLSIADIGMAGAAWRWLTRSRLLGGAFQDPCTPCATVASLHGVGVSLGVAEARRVIDTCGGGR